MTRGVRGACRPTPPSPHRSFPSGVDKMGSAFSKKKKDKKNAENDRLNRRLSVAGDMPQPGSGDPLAGHGQTSDKGQSQFLRYAALSNAGYEPDGGKKVNQDSFVSLLDFGDASVSVFGVFDGHGAVGHTVSQFVKKKWPETMDRALMNVETQNPSKGDQVRRMLERSFTETNKLLEKDRQIDSSLSGTTATGGVVYGPPSRRMVMMANAGDSRVIIATEQNGELVCTALSDDHKPDRPDERKRIEESGGRVEPLFDEDGEAIGPARVWLPHMMMPGLAMARSIGDDVAATVGVHAFPEVMMHQLTPNDKFMVLASDGVWEFLSNEQVIKIVADCQGDEVAAAKAVCDKSYDLWRQEEEVVDDITAVVVYFKH